MKLTSLLVLTVALLSVTTERVVVAQVRPSDTNNQPGTPAPGATSQPPGHTPPPGAPSTPSPGTLPPTTPTPTSTAPPTTAPTPTSATPPPTPPPAVTTPPPTAAISENATTTPSVITTESPGVPPEPMTENPFQVPIASSSTESSSEGLSAGAAIGIVMTCFAIVAIIAFFIYRRKYARREDSKDFDYEASLPMTALHFSHLEDDDQKFSILEAPRNQSTSSDSHRSYHHKEQHILYEEPSQSPLPEDATMANRTPRQSSPRLSSEAPTHEAIGDFTRSLNNSNKSPTVTHSPPNERVSETESHESYAESYADGYRGTGGTFQSFDLGNMGRDTLNSTIDPDLEEGTTNTSAEPAEVGHWMEAMDEIRNTNDSYAMLEDGAGSYGSGRGSAMRFSTDSEYTSRM